MRLLNVGEVIGKDLVKCSLGCTIEETARLMVESDVRSIIIEDAKGDPVGIVTAGDIVKAVAKKMGPESKVDEITGKNLVTIDVEEDIIEAAKIMNERNIKRLAVTENGRLTGIITSSDVLKYSLRYLHEFSRTFDKIDTIIKKL